MTELPSLYVVCKKTTQVYNMKTDPEPLLYLKNKVLLYAGFHQRALLRRTKFKQAILLSKMTFYKGHIVLIGGSIAKD